MSFTSISFFIFIAAVSAVYYVFPKKFQWVILLVASYLFYAVQGWRCMMFLLVTTVTVYLTAVAVGWMQKNTARVECKMSENEVSGERRKEYKAGRKKREKYLVAACILFNLSILAVLKYINFGIDNLNRITTFFGQSTQITYQNLFLPLGISFYMFQSIGYLLDVYWKRVQVQTNVFRLALFVSFFPQLGQGPISRYDSLSRTLYTEHPFDAVQVRFGLERILWGIFKKLVIADRIAVAVQSLAADPGYYRGAFVVVLIVFYAVQLYCDFTGGIDITIGVAQIFGVKVTENFLRPFFAKGIKEYWRRWHITMGTWFRDYVFYPFSISKPLRRLVSFVKKHFGMPAAKRVSVYTATIVLWVATGIWHGAYWRFVVWGLMNGIIIIISQELEPLYKRFHHRFPRVTAGVPYKGFMVVRTFFLMGSLRLFDNARGCRDAFISFWSIFSQWDVGALTVQEFLDLGLTSVDYAVVAAGIFVVFMASLLQRKQPVRQWLGRRSFLVQYFVLMAMFLSVVLFGMYGIGYDSAGFIYNQF